MPNGEHREIESKFDITGELPRRELARVAGVAAIEEPEQQDLDAEYYDTGDHRLLAAGITLRRRTGGTDAGWHLKLARAPGERVEVQRPLDGAPGIPPELLDAVVVHARRTPLAAIARVHTHRTVHRLVDEAGEPLAEVADDRVAATDATGHTQEWREVEVELAGGGDDDLRAAIAEVLVAGGASPAPQSSKLERAVGPPVEHRSRPPHPHLRRGSAGAVVANYLRSQVVAMVDADPAVRLDLGDAVHDMRVAIRRLRSTLATYRRLLDRDAAQRLRDELAWLGGVLGPVRDGQVIREHLDVVLDDEPDSASTKAARERIDGTLVHEHGEAHQAAVQAMSSDRYLALIDELQAVDRCVLPTKPARRRAAKELAKHVRRSHRRLHRALDAALGDEIPSDVQMHEVRKAAKRVRYAAESAHPAYGSKAEKLSASMERIQETLGDHQDTVVIRGVVCRLADEAATAGENTFAFGRIHALEQARGRGARDAWLESVHAGAFDPPRWLR